MYIKSISLKNFKRFAEFTANFTSDITVVKGPNEQGKSTLLAAFLAGLFYDPKKDNKQIRALQSWQSDTLYETTFQIEHDGEEIVLHKNFQDSDLYLENKTKGEKLTAHADIAKYLNTIGALRTLALFRHTACVYHDALARVGEGKKEIAHALEALLTSSEENVSTDAIIKKTRDIVSEMQKGLRQPAKQPGALKQIEDALTQLRAKQQSITDALQKTAQSQSHITDLRAQYARVVYELEAKKKQHQKNADYFKTTEEIKKLRAQFDMIHTDVATLKDIATKKEYLLFRLDQMRSLETIDLETLFKLQEKLALKKEQMTHFTNEQKHLGLKGKSQQTHMKKPYFFATIALFLFGFLGFWDPRFFILWGLFIFSFIYSYILRHGLTMHTSVLVGTQLSGLRHEIAALEKQLSQTLGSAGVPDEKTLMERIHTYNEFGADLAKLESKEEGILRLRSPQELTDQQNEIAKQIALWEAKISDEEKMSAPSPEVQRALEVDVEALARKEKELSGGVREAESAGKTEYNFEDLARVEEEIEHKSKQEAKAQKKLKTLQLLLDALQDAQKKTVEGSRKQIEVYMQNYLGIVTEEKYRKVEVADDFSFSVWSGEKKGMITPEEHLSKGAIDQFYLISRLAVLDLLNKGVKSLLLLDDPFHSFDAGRKAKMKEILLDMTDKFQIILFTHSSEYDSWGDVVTI